ncbi:MAG: ligase-associated DNA damage response exonuclease [Pseudobdellovibrionaceae bacterium]
MITLTPQGLYCRPGKFYIDPSRAVEHAVVTHAHSDHARRGSARYYCASVGKSLLKVRLGKNIAVQGFEYGEIFELGGVQISLHSAGHILGSAQVRMEYQGEVWVISGDYKRDFDPTCHPFDPVTCDVFVTEATFGTPAFQWKKNIDVGKQIYEWWNENSQLGLNSVLFAYSLGKAQRVLGVLKPYAQRPIYCDTPVSPLTECYRNQGIALADTICLSQLTPDQKLRGELFLVPQSFLKTTKAKVLGENFQTAFASGWMAQGTRGYSKGFVLSDHADWNDLLETIFQTRAQRIYVQHRGNGALVKHLRNMGLQAFSDSHLKPSIEKQLELF